MASSNPRISIVVVVGPEDRHHVPSLLAEVLHAPDIELVIVDHCDGEYTPLEAAGATVVSSHELGHAAAFVAGAEASQGAYVAYRSPGAQGVVGALSSGAVALDQAEGAWLYAAGYHLTAAGGSVVHAVNPEQDGDAPPPGFESGLMFTRDAALSLDTAVGVPVFIDAVRRARAESAIVYGDVGFSMAFDQFALQRFDHRRDLHLLAIRDEVFDSPDPWMTVVVCVDELAGARATVERLARQVMPRNTFELVLADRSGAGDLAKAAERATCVAPLSAVHAPGAHRAEALNRAVETARGRVLLFVDSHGLPFPDLVEQHARAQRSMAPREVVVLGTWETPAAELSGALARLLDSSDLVPGRSALAGGQFHDGQSLHAANLSVPVEVFTRAGGFDAALPESHIDPDLGIRLAELGYRPYYHEAARVLRGAGPDLDALRSQRIADARGSVAFYQKHPDVLEKLPLAGTTLAGLDQTISDNAATVVPVGAAAASLASIALAPIEQVGDDWRAFTEDCVDRLDKLVRHLDALWRAEGLRQGLKEAGLEGLPALLAQHPLPIAGARTERILLMPHEEGETEWMLAIARYMAGYTGDDDATLVVIADEAAGVPVATVQHACQLLSATVRPPQAGGWPHVLVIDRGTVGGGLLRILAGMSSWIATESPTDEEIRGLQEHTGTAPVDTSAWEARRHGVAPMSLRTRAPIRIFAWPDWSSTDDLDALFKLAGDALADRGDATLCLRWAPTDTDPDAALERLAGAYEACLGTDRALDVLLIEQPLSSEELPALRVAIDGILALPSSATGEHAAFFTELGGENISAPEALVAHVQAVAARSPGLLMPNQVYVG